MMTLDQLAEQAAMEVFKWCSADVGDGVLEQETGRIIREAAATAYEQGAAAATQQINEAMKLLAPACAEETLIGAIRNLQQAHLSEKGNCEFVEQQLEAQREQLAQLQREHEALKSQYAAYRAGICERDESAIVDDLRQQLSQVTQAKDGAYAERNKLVVALSKLLPSHLARHADEDATWEDDWRWIVVVNGPAGQMTWHIHDSEREQFNHLEVRLFVWDGHDTPEKYRRLAMLSAVEKDRDERFTEADVRALMLDAADEWDRMPLRYSHERKTLGELVDSLLAEHKAQHACATPTNSSPLAPAVDAPSSAGE